MRIDELEKKNKFEGVSAIANIVMALASLLTLMITSFGNKANLPIWFLYLPLFFLIIPFVWLIVRYIPPVVNRRKLNKIATLYHAKLNMLIEEFYDLTNTRMGDTITYALQNIKQGEIEFQNRKFAELIDWVTSNLISKIKSSPKTFDNLTTYLHELFILTHSYYNNYYIETFKKLRALDPEMISVNDRRIIETARENFVMYINKFQAYCKEIDVASGIEKNKHYFEKSSHL